MPSQPWLKPSAALAQKLSHAAIPRGLSGPVLPSQLASSSSSPRPFEVEALFFVGEKHKKSQQRGLDVVQFREPLPGALAYRGGKRDPGVTAGSGGHRSVPVCPQAPHSRDLQLSTEHSVHVAVPGVLLAVPVAQGEAQAWWHLWQNQGLIHVGKAGQESGERPLWDFMSSCGSVSPLGPAHPTEPALVTTLRRCLGLPCSGQVVPSPVISLQIFFSLILLIK